MRRSLASFWLSLLSLSAWSAFPTIEGITSTEIASNVTTHSVQYPSGTNSVGDLIVQCGTVDASSGTTVTDPSGFVAIYNDKVGTNHIVGVCSVLNAAGGESGTVEWSSSDSQRSCWISFRVPAAEWAGDVGTDVEGSISSQTGTGTDPDPPSVTATWGSNDNLWIAIGHSDASDATTFTVYPESDNQGSCFSASSAGGGVGISTYDGAAASTRNPSAYVLDAADQRLGGTIVIEPAATSTSATVQRRRRMQ